VSIINAKSLTLEKGDELVLPIYLDNNNSSEEIEYMSITILHDSDLFTPIGFRKDNGILFDYTLNETLKIKDTALVNIRGNGVYTQFGPVVEFVLIANNMGHATIYLNKIYCNYHNLSGGFWLDDDFFQKVDIEIVETNRFYISEIEDVEVYEDHPILPITFSLNIPDENPTGLIHTIPESSNTDLINKMNIRRTRTQCSLEIYTNENVFGKTEISITAQYNVEKDTKTFTLEIKPVNDAPTFSMPSTIISLAETSGPQIFKNWATNISPGAPNEMEQELSFIIDVDQPELFYLLPEIDPATGDLSFFPFDNRNGQTQFSVYLQDNGYTENGGRNLSAKQDCLLTITPFLPTISDNPIEKLKFISSNQPILAEKVTPFIRIMACDANGDAVLMDSDTKIWLQTESPETAWFSVKNNDWTRQTANIVIPEGEHSVLFKYRNGRPGTFQIKASEDPDQNWEDAIMTIHVKSDSAPINGDINGNGRIDLQDIIREMKELSK
jgi:hypothetical protein